MKYHLTVRELKMCYEFNKKSILKKYAVDGYFVELI